jgi:hypothetical protein
MKKFILSILSFLLIVLIFNGIVLFFADFHYYKNYDKKPNKNFRSFIMSDSHGLPIGKFSEEFNVYNFSAGSDSYLDIERKIKYLIENDYKIDTIYITVDDHGLSPQRETANNLDRSVIYSSEDEYDSSFSYFREKYLKYYLAIFQPRIRTLFKQYLKENFKHIYFKKNNNLDNDIPWFKLSESERIIRVEFRKQSQFGSEFKSKKLEEKLVEIINLCKKNNIELFGVKFPLPNTYVKMLGDKNFGADKVFLSNGIEVFDYKLIFIDHNEYFKNTDHMNSKGGKIFTKVLLGK